MNIGSSNIVLTDLNGRSGTAAIACHLDTDTNIVTGEIRFGSYKSDTESLGVLSDIVEKFVDLFDTGDLTEIEIQWRDSVVIRHPAEGSNHFRIEIGGLTVSYQQFLELLVELDNAAGDITDNYNTVIDAES